MQTVLITGGGIGIGRACALGLADAGYRVIVTDVLTEEGRAVAEEIIRLGGEAEFHVMDVTSSTGVDAVVAQVERSHGPLAVLVCNAGIAKRLPLASLEDAAWEYTQSVNVTGMMRVLRAANPAMRRAGRGAVVCISSVVGTAYGWDEHLPYCASKGAVAGFVRGAAIELASAGIRVNGIAPGFIRTAQTLDGYHSVGESGLEAVAPRIPLGRVGDPRDIADVVRFLVSDEARYITGQVITVDGGLLVGL